MLLSIEKYKQEFEEINSKLSDPSKVDSRELGKFFSKQAELQQILDLHSQVSEVEKKVNEDKTLLQTEKDPEILEMATLEIEQLEEKKKSLESKLQLLIIPSDPNDEKNVIMEIRAGTGGEEASLFAGDLFRMYTRFTSLMHWQIQLLNIAESETNGIKEAVFKVIGKNAYKILKSESGVHRVQRVPETESAGRIHTSAASVVVMPEIDDIDIKINQSDLRIDVYRSSGHGGQSVNTTDSAVRITHLPTGMVVTCQDTKDQQKNKVSALSVLRSRLYQMELEKQQSEISDIRKTSIKTGDRSDKIKTYNFPQDRLTDHRIHKSWFGLDKIMNGEVKEVLEETLVELAKNR